jgi:metal-responsive CopG/Arc/MetJ family transcriptional regulator
MASATRKKNKRFYFLLMNDENSDEMVPVQVRVNKKLLDMVDELIESGLYSNRSEAIREAVRSFVEKHNSKY